MRGPVERDRREAGADSPGPVGGLAAAVLALAPASFRRRYGADLLATHRERQVAASARGRSAALRVRVRELAGLVWLVVRVRLGAGEREPRGGRSGRAWPLAGVVQDVRFALRALRRSPSYAVTAVLVLALGIGAGTAIFSAVNAFFFRPLPFAAEDRLMMLYETNPEFEWDDATAAPANMLDWRARVDAFDDVAAFSESLDRATHVRDGEPLLFGATAVTGNFFSVLGVRAAVGRTLEWDETWEGASDVVVLSHGLWVRHFGADSSVVGRSYDIGGRRMRVVGVMPERFSFPSDRTELWYAWGWGAEAREETWFRRAHFVRAFTRLEAGVTREQAGAQLQGVVRRLQREYPETNAVMGAGMMPLRDFLIRDARRPLMILLGAVGLLLLLACANVANLTLVRGSARTREMALRHALGAGRGRVAQQLLTESLVLAAAGGVLGIGIGWFGVRAMARLTRLGIDGATSIALDGRVILFTMAVTVASGVLFGLVPVLRATTGRIYGTLVEGGTGASAGRSTQRAMGVLVVAEVALALLLVAAAGLMTRSYDHMRRVDPGFDREYTLAFRVTAAWARYTNRDEVLAFQDRLIDELEGRPGIERAGIVANLPLDGPSWSSQVKAAGWPPDRVGLEILHRRADAGYFDALGIPLLRGRMFERRDGPDAPTVTIINETFAREHFPGEDPIGQRIAYDRVPDENSEWHEIIGIVGDQQQLSPTVPARAEAFENRRQDWDRTTWVVVRTTGDPAQALPTVRSALHDIDPLIPIAESRTLREVWRASMAREEFILTLLAIFGVVALLLATVGVYAITAQAARRRTREVGIRMALGAAAGDVVALMLRQSLAAVTVGLIAGLALALAAGRVLASVLFGVTPSDPMTLLAVVLLFGGVATVACWLPARRATTVDPVSSLRPE